MAVSIENVFSLCIFSEYRKKCDKAKARLDSLQQKEKQYRELMIKLTGNTEKRCVSASDAEGVDGQRVCRSILQDC